MKLITLMLLIAICGVAQITTVEILGTVTDSSGAVVVDAAVQVRNLGTNAVREVRSGASGQFVVTQLPPGRYRVEVQRPGFQTWTIADLALAAGDRYRADVRLEVGTAEQHVDVQAYASAIQTDHSTVGALINSRNIQDLPLNNGNYVGLLQIAPGATAGNVNSINSGNRPDDRRRTSAVSTGGQDDTYNNWLIDGMDNNVGVSGMTVIKPSMAAIQEVRYQASLYSSEVGRSAGGVVDLITRSGSNKIQGSLFEFFRNQHTDAKNFFAGPGPTPAYRQNQYGGNLGGPVRRNKLFFFTDYEGLNVAQGVTYTSTIPTPAMVGGNFTGANAIFDPLSTQPNPSVPGGYVRTAFPGNTIPAPRINPVGQRLASLYPAPTSAGLVNNYTQSPNQTQNNETADVRIDWLLTATQSLFARYSVNDTTTTVPAQLPAANLPGVGAVQAGGDNSLYAGSTAQRSQNAQLNYNYPIRANLLLQSGFSYGRFALHTLPINYGIPVASKIGIPGVNSTEQDSGLPSFTLAGYRGLGDAISIPIFDLSNTFEYLASLNWIKGRHSVKTGFELTRRQINYFASQAPTGQYSFDANLTNDPSGATAGSGNAVASLLVGYPASTSRTENLYPSGFRALEIGAFVQDDWRATSHLTLNLGLRYDYFPPWSEVCNRLSLLNMNTLTIQQAGVNGVNNVGGIAKNHLNFAPRIGFAYSLPSKTVLRGGYGISYFPIPSGQRSGLLNPPLAALYSVTATAITPINSISDGIPISVPVDPNNPTGNLRTNALSDPTPYVQQLNLTIEREMATDLVASVGYGGTLGRHQWYAENVNLAPPGPGAIQARRPYYSKLPNVSTITVDSSVYDGNYDALQARLERRFHSGLGLMTAYTWSHSIDNYPSYSGGKFGSSPWPQLSNNLRLERGNSDLDIRQRFVMSGNYELPLARSWKGLPGAIGRGWQINGILLLQSGTTFTIQNGSSRANTGGSDRPNTVPGVDPNLPASARSINHWFNTAAFVAQPLYTIGNVARNSIYGPGRVNLDVGIFKSFALSERTRLEFRAQAFNLTNTPAFDVPGASLGTGTFGVISSATLPARNVQFGLKLLF